MVLPVGRRKDLGIPSCLVVLFCFVFFVWSRPILDLILSEAAEGETVLLVVMVLWINHAIIVV